MRAVLASPERVAALVLIGSESGVFTDEEKVGFSEWVSQSQATPLNAEVRDGVAKMLFGSSPVSQHWWSRWERAYRSKITFPADALINRDDITNALVDMSCPSLVIHGTADEGGTIEKGPKLAIGLRSQYPVAEISQGPHAVNVKHPVVIA